MAEFEESAQSLDVTDEIARDWGAENFANREWRLKTLYRIRDENGTAIRFRPNDAQRAFDENMWFRNVIPKARKLGFSTFISMFILDECASVSGTVCGITDITIADAEDKLAMIKFAYEGMPKRYRDEYFRLKRANDKYIEWSNGSSVSVGLTYRGGTPRILHVSELGKVSVNAPEQAREIMTGAIQAVPQTGIVFVESTAHGTSGIFCDMVRKAEARRISNALETPLDFRSQFFGWMHKREYRVPNNLVIVPQELRQYFLELEAKHGIKLDADQMAWYAQKHDQLGPDDCRQEFPSIPDELFYSSLQGAYWRKEMTKARADGRIGGKVPFDPSRPVNTFWDIGEDCTAIWFHQTDGVRHRFIDYYEEEGGSIQSACAVVHAKQKDRGFVYKRHYFPHDLDRRSWENNATNRKDIAEGLLGASSITVVARIEDKSDSIEAGRRMLNMAWVDDEHCRRGVEVLDNYRKAWNEKMGMFKSEPVHDWASHGSDALQQGAMGLEPERASRREGRHALGSGPRASSWSA